MEDNKTIFTTLSLGVNEKGEDRYLYTGLSIQTQPHPRKADNDVMFLIDTGEWFHSVKGKWVKSAPK